MNIVDDNDTVEFIPAQETENFNFKPALRFDNANDVLTRDGGLFTESDDLRDVHTYVVHRSDNHDTSGALHYEIVNSGSVYGLDTNSTGAAGTFYRGHGNDTVNANKSGSDWALDTIMIRRDISSTTGGDEQSISINGQVQIQEAEADDTVTGVAANDFFMGATDLVNNTAYDGEIAEVIFYNGDQTAADIVRIESYLAMKYGVTQLDASSQDYIASDGSTVMWDSGDALGTFVNNIAGLGVDSGSGLANYKTKPQGNAGSHHTHRRGQHNHRPKLPNNGV